METVRFIERGAQSFYGDYLYDLIVPADHFLRKLNAIIAWARFHSASLRDNKHRRVHRYEAVQKG